MRPAANLSAIFRFLSTLDDGEESAPSSDFGGVRDREDELPSTERYPRQGTKISA
jgi:hypothetical protein